MSQEQDDVNWDEAIAKGGVLGASVALFILSMVVRYLPPEELEVLLAKASELNTLAPSTIELMRQHLNHTGLLASTSLLLKQGLDAGVDEAIIKRLFEYQAIDAPMPESNEYDAELDEALRDIDDAQIEQIFKRGVPEIILMLQQLVSSNPNIAITTALMIAGVAVEAYQAMLPTPSVDPKDHLANLAGIMIGLYGPALALAVKDGIGAATSYIQENLSASMGAMREEIKVQQLARELSSDQPRLKPHGELLYELQR